MENSHWYVLYTHSRAEKKVTKRIEELAMDSFLPLHTISRQWSDRVKKVEVPLFPNYVFAYTKEDNIPKLMRVEGVACLLSFGGKWATIREQEIVTIRQIVNTGQQIQIEKGQIRKGQRIRICKGNLAGVEGVLVEESGKNRFLLAIDSLDQLLSIWLSSDLLTDGSFALL